MPAPYLPAATYLQGPYDLGVVPKGGFPLGLLYKLGRTLDWPGRKIREMIAGEPEATGRRILQKMGLLERNIPGFDLGDVMGFATEVGLDPLTYLYGVGTLTKGGKLASRAGSLSRELGALRALGRPEAKAAEIALKGVRKAMRETGAPFKLAPGWAAQARAGQRSLLKIGLPFTKIEKTLIRGAPVLGGLEKIERFTKALPPIQLLSRLFSPRFGRPEVTRPMYEALDVARGVRGTQAGQLRETLTKRLGPLIARSGKPEGEYLPDFIKVVESLDQPDRITRRLELLREEWKPRFAEVEAKIANASKYTETSWGREWLRTVDRERKRLEREFNKLAKPLEKGLAETTEVLEKATPEELKLATQLQKLLARTAKQQIKAGARDPGMLLSAVTKGYYPRMAGEGMKEFKKRFPDLWKIELNRLKRDFKTMTGSQIPRERALLELFTPEASETLQKVAQTQKPWYELDPRKALPQYYLREKISTDTAKFLRHLIREYKMPHVPGRTMEVAELIKRGELHNVKPSQWKGWGIPLDMAQEFLTMHRTFTQPEEITRVMRIFDSLTGVFRGMLTSPFPAFHIRNLFSDTALSAIGGGANLRFIRQAIQQSFDPAWLRRGEELGVLRGSSARYVMEELGTRNPSTLIGEWLQAHPGLKKAMHGFDKWYASRVENFTRTWHFISKKAEGLSDLEAAREVRKWLLDYSELTPFERKFMKRTFLFYNWPRKVIPLLVKSYFERPRQMALLTRLTTQPSMPREMPVPEFVRATAAVPVGVNLQGDPRFLFGMGSPLEELNKLDISSPLGLAGGMQQIMRRVGVQMNPLLRAPLEYATGKELYYDRPIILSDKAEPILDQVPLLRNWLQLRREELPGGKVRYRADPYRYWLFKNMPTSRFEDLANQLADVVGNVDPRKSGLQSLIQALTGVKVASLDPMDQIRTLVDWHRAQAQPLVRQGLMGELPILYPRTVSGEKAPEAVEFSKQHREFREMLKSMREQVNAPP